MQSTNNDKCKMTRYKIIALTTSTNIQKKTITVIK